MLDNGTWQKNNHVLKTCSESTTGRKSINVYLGQENVYSRTMRFVYDSRVWFVERLVHVCFTDDSTGEIRSKPIRPLICSDVVVGKTRISLQLGKPLNHGYVLELRRGGESATLFPKIAKEVLQWALGILWRPRGRVVRILSLAYTEVQRIPLVASALLISTAFNVFIPTSIKSAPCNPRRAVPFFFYSCLHVQEKHKKINRTLALEGSNNYNYL